MHVAAGLRDAVIIEMLLHAHQAGLAQPAHLSAGLGQRGEATLADVITFRMIEAVQEDALTTSIA